MSASCIYIAASLVTNFVYVQKRFCIIALIQHLIDQLVREGGFCCPARFDKYVVTLGSLQLLMRNEVGPGKDVHIERHFGRHQLENIAITVERSYCQFQADSGCRLSPEAVGKRQSRFQSSTCVLFVVHAIVVQCELNPNGVLSTRADWYHQGIGTSKIDSSSVLVDGVIDCRATNFPLEVV